MLKNRFYVLALCVFLVACGGGGGSSSTHMPPSIVPDHLPFPFRGRSNQHYDTSMIPKKTSSDARHMPIYHDGTYDAQGGYPTSPEARERRLFVGIDQGESVARLPIVRNRGDVEVRHGRLNDGMGSDVVVDYISGSIDPPQFLRSGSRYNTSPAVRLIGPADGRDLDIVIAAVQVVNAALPESAKMRVGPSLPNFSLRHTVNSGGRYFTSGEERDNTIHIEFLQAGEYFGHGNSGATTWSNFSGSRVRNSYIQFDKGAPVYQDSTDRRSVILMAHEIIHALGFYGGGHVSPEFDTIMEATNNIYSIAQGKPQPMSILYPVDREALQAYYRHLGNGLRPESLGPWTSTSIHIHGNGPHAGFGVALRNGYAEPWAYGYMPDTDLAANRSLSGSVSWIGTILGLTPNAASVAGDAEIGVNLGTLTGYADFRNLETWGNGLAPGETGTGTQWLDGDLGYSIAVRGNTFKQTVGDEGIITGIFVGRSHEGAAGTLERQDLTAAFGASR